VININWSKAMKLNDGSCGIHNLLIFAKIYKITPEELFFKNLFFKKNPIAYK